MFQKKLSVRLPKTFVTMPEKYQKLKYPSENRPMVIKTNYPTTINFCFNYFTNHQGLMNVKVMAEEYLNVTKRLNPHLDIISFQELKDHPLVVENLLYVKDIAFYDFVTPTITENAYNLHFFCFIEGHMLHSVFNCPETEWENWKETALEVFNSTHQVSTL